LESAVTFVFGDCMLDIARRELRRGGALVAVEPQVFDLLVYLIRNRGRVVARDDLIETIWGGRIVSSSAVTTRINAARKAIGDSGAAQQLVRTVPRRGIRFIGEVEEHAAPVETVRSLVPTETIVRALPDKPSIAVLPFVNMSGDPEQDYFADGMVEEITTGLSRISWLFVIARNSSFVYKGKNTDIRQVGRELGVRYVLEGSVRRSATHLRITAQLIDAATGTHLWGERFDGPIEDVFALQDRVAFEVAGLIEVTLKGAESQRSLTRPLTDLTTYDLYLRARSISWAWNRASMREALELLGRAIERDPEFGPALALASACHTNLHVGLLSDDLDRSRREAMDFARRSLRSAGDDPEVLGYAALTLGYFGEDIRTSISLVDRALALNPSFARGWATRAWLRVWAGESEPAIGDFAVALRLSPRATAPNWLIGSGIAAFFARRFADAEAMLLRSLQGHPDWPPTFRFLAACYAHMGRLDDARGIVERLRILTPSVIVPPLHWRNVDDREFYLAGLRLAAGEAP
jgi:adenylate cyclase